MSNEAAKGTTPGKSRAGVDERAHEYAATCACPVCGGRLMEIRGKLQCTRCRTICETCCEGGRG